MLGGERPEALPLVKWDFSRLPAGTPRFATRRPSGTTARATRMRPRCSVNDLPAHVVKVYRAVIECIVESAMVRTLG